MDLPPTEALSGRRGNGSESKPILSGSRHVADHRGVLGARGGRRVLLLLGDNRCRLLTSILLLLVGLTVHWLCKRNFDVCAFNISPYKPVNAFLGLLVTLKMDECVVSDFLHSLYDSKLGEHVSEGLFSGGEHQVSDV